MSKVLVTGANGFIGKILLAELIAAGFDVKGAVRSSVSCTDQSAAVAVGDINAGTSWQEALQGVDVVVHLAARVHVMKETVADSLQAFREVNVAGTENLARQAAANGVRRFIYLSSIKVNGDQTDRAFSAGDNVIPQGPYALSKWEAEQALGKVSAETGLEIVIIRPPLAYGPGVKGNFLRLLKLVKSGCPLPLGKVNNRRSMVSVDNLCDLIKTCIDHPGADGQVFLVSDGYDMSTLDLVKMMATHMRRSVRLLSLPLGWLYGLGKIAGKKPEISRLCASLQVDIQQTCNKLQWTPPYSVDEEVRKTVAWFMAQKQ
jgi:nucleoside-diphosphate-sugar epimerase